MRTLVAVAVLVCWAAAVECATFSCSLANAPDQLTLSCTNGNPITSIDFASYGTPTGACPPNGLVSTAGVFSIGQCNAPTSQAAVQAMCLGKSLCSFPTTLSMFGADPCPGLPKSAAVVYSCGTTCAAPPSVSIMSFSTFCSTVSLTWAPTDNCPADSIPLYTARLVKRVTFEARSLVTDLTSVQFEQVALADYFVDVTVACVGATGDPVCVSAPALIQSADGADPLGPVIRPFVCCVDNCDGPVLGDPHFKTLDGCNVDYYLPGDYILAMGAGFSLQSRMCNRNWGWSVNCGVAQQCGTTTIVVRTDQLSATPIIYANNVKQTVSLGVEALYGGGKAVTGGSTVKVSNRLVELWCKPTDKGRFYVRLDVQQANQYFYLDVTMKAHSGIRGARGLIAGRYDNNTYNDIQYRNGTVYSIGKNIDPSTNVLAPYKDATLNKVQSSWAVYGPAESLFAGVPVFGQEGASASWWARPARRRLLQTVATTLGPSEADMAVGRAACKPFITGGGDAPLENAAFDYIAAGKKVDCSLIAPKYNTRPLVVNGVGSTSRRRGLRQSDDLSQPVTVCGAGGDVIRVSGKFDGDLASVAVGGYTARIVKATKRQLYVKTQNFLNAAGVMDLEIGNSDGARLTVFKSVDVKSSYIDDIGAGNETVARGDQLLVTGYFGNKGIKSVRIGGKDCPIVAQTRKQVLITIPDDCPLGTKNVVVRTKACFGDAVLPLGITVVPKGSK